MAFMGLHAVQWTLRNITEKPFQGQFKIEMGEDESMVMMIP